jgi:hypothetical protein
MTCLRTTRLTGGACFAAVLLALPAAAQSPAGPQFRVNTYTTSDPMDPAVAMDAAANPVVAWIEREGNAADLRARRFDAHGAPRGDEFVVTSNAYQALKTPRVASDANGNFVVSWQERLPASTGSRIVAQRFDAAGAPRGAAFQVNTQTSGTQIEPDLAMAPDGAFVVAWRALVSGQSSSVMVRRFAADGAPQGIEFTVDASDRSGNQHYPSVSAGATGDFVVAWTRAYAGIGARRFSADGTPLGPFFAANEGLGRVGGPDVAVLPSGGFVIGWGEFNSFYPYSELKAHLFAADGTSRGSEFLVRRWGDGVGPVGGSIVPLPDDGFVVANGIARRFDASGQPLGRSFELRTAAATGIGFGTVLATDGAGNLLAVGSHSFPAPNGIYGQRFGRLGAVGLAVDTAGGAGSDGNGVLEPGETVDLRPTWHNGSGASQTWPATLAAFEGWGQPTIVDGAGSYGTVPDGATQTCVDCYRVGLAPTDPRPAVHVDDTATELLEDGTDGTAYWPVHIGGSFPDVPRSSPFYRSVETILHRGVTAGCTPSTYCPGQPVTRGQMAVFVLAASSDTGYFPRQCNMVFPPVFDDVPRENPLCRWVEELAQRGVVSGCGGGHFCPDASVTREQVAVFLLKTLDPALDPPACTTPVFDDVPASSPFCRWIEELVRRGITGGCGGGHYCPGQPVTREQMAVFLTTTFGLTLYGP